MNRKAFYHLLQRYLEGTCTEEEKKLIEQWYELLDDHEPAMAAADIKEIVQKLWPKIKEQTTPLFRPAPVKAMPVWVRLLIAAAVVAVVFKSVSLFYHSGNDVQKDKNEMAMSHLIKTENVKTIKDTVYLSDNSMVILEPNARLYYAESYNTVKREVYLEGNAFFKIARNPKCPFYVHSNNIVTQVLGTSFFIKTHAATNDVEVSVRTGKVAVYEDEKAIEKDGRNEESNGVILKPNQKVIYYREGHHFRTTLVDAPLPLLSDNKADEKITELNFVFEETPIAKVLARLEDAYHIEIVMENESLANCLFSGDIKGQDLYDQLEIICQSVQANYEVRGTRILIKGTGCR